MNLYMWLLYMIFVSDYMLRLRTVNCRLGEADCRHD